MAKGKVVLGTVVAAVGGFITGVLLAPKSGKETRKDIKDTALKTKDTAVKEVKKVEKAAVRKATEVRGKAEEVVEEVKIDPQPERRDQPSHDPDRAARRQPPPTPLLEVGRPVVDDREA